MLFRFYPKALQRAIDAFFMAGLIILALLFLFAWPKGDSDPSRTMQLQHAAMNETGLRCVRVILAEPGRIDCYDGSGRTVLMHTDATGWVEQ